MRAPGGWAPPARVLGVRGWALSHVRPPVLWACGRGPLPTRCWCGGSWRWDSTPTPQSALLRPGFARCKGGRRAPRGERLLPGLRASGVGRSSTPNRPSLGRAAGTRYPLAVVAGAVGVETRYQPHSARSCELALRAVGAARGHRVGNVSCLGSGRPGLCPLPRPTARPWGVRPGPATHWP